MVTFYQKAELYAKPSVNSCLSLAMLPTDPLATSTNLPPFRVKTSLYYTWGGQRWTLNPHIIFMRPVRSDNKGSYDQGTMVTLFFLQYFSIWVLRHKKVFFGHSNWRSGKISFECLMIHSHFRLLKDFSGDFVSSKNELAAFSSSRQISLKFENVNTVIYK